MHASTMFLLPWGSLEAMELSDPETKPSPNQLADIHMHIWAANYTAKLHLKGGVSPLKMNQTVKNWNVL